MVTRRDFLAEAAALPFLGDFRTTPVQVPHMQLALHQNTSRAAGFRGSLEGWSQAGIRYVDLDDDMLDGFLETDSLAGAGRLLADLGLTPVAGVATIQDIWIPGPARAQSLETWHRRCAMYAALGLQRIYAPSLTDRRVTVDDFRATPDCIAEAGEIARQYGLTAMIEFTHTSTHLATLTSTLFAIRAAGHPNVRLMLDCFHFWSGASKFEDLDLLRPGELAHVHFEDVRNGPRELADDDDRLIPGDGGAPLVRIIQKLDAVGYDRALSVELFHPEFVTADPYEIGSEIRLKCEGVMHAAGVL